MITTYREFNQGRDSTMYFPGMLRFMLVSISGFDPHMCYAYFTLNRSIRRRINSTLTHDVCGSQFMESVFSFTLQSSTLSIRFPYVTETTRLAANPEKKSKAILGQQCGTWQPFECAAHNLSGIPGHPWELPWIQRTGCRCTSPSSFH